MNLKWILVSKVTNSRMHRKSAQKNFVHVYRVDQTLSLSLKITDGEIFVLMLIELLKNRNQFRNSSLNCVARMYF